MFDVLIISIVQYWVLNKKKEIFYSIKFKWNKWKFQIDYIAEIINIDQTILDIWIEDKTKFQSDGIWIENKKSM